MINLYVNGTLVDLSEDFDLLITRSIADIREPEKRQSDWSKTLTIPGTKVNNTLFSNIFDVSNVLIGTTQFAPSYNPNKKATALVLKDGMQVLNGFIRLIQINVLDNNFIEYECSLHGETADLFTTIGNAKLSGLDFAEYNHVLNSTNVTNSWDTSIIKNNAPIPFEFGNGYVYAQAFDKYATKGQDATSWRVDDHLPCLYAKTVVDKIFANAGYQYTTDSFFNSDRFKHLVIPFNNFGLITDSSSAINRKFQAQVTGNNNYNTNDVVRFNNDSTGGNFDNGGNFNTTSYTYTVPNTGLYDLYLQLDATFTYPYSLTTFFYAEFAVYKNGSFFATLPLFSSTITLPNLYNFNEIQFITSQLIQGDVIEIKFNGIYANATKFVFTPGTFRINSPTYFYNQTSTLNYGYNNTLDFGYFFTGDYTQKDLILSFVKMFNLYIEPNYDNPKSLRIVTRDEFYNGSSLDWSKKLDYSQNVEILPMGDMDANPYIFTYKEGDDDYNKDYKQSTNRIYGDRIIRVDNDFIKDEKKIEINFVPTLFLQDKTTSRYYSIINSTNNNSGQLRLLYYSGVSNCTAYTVYETAIATGTFFFKYPLTLHIDSVSNMQFDLNFGMSKYILAGKGLQFSNQNLVNVYWFKTLSEITDKNSKIFRGYFRINDYDWNNLRFNNIYFFEKQYWRLNKVIDYNPLQDGVYQCEFLLLTYYVPTNATQLNIGLGSSDYLGDFFPYGKPQGFTGVRNGGVNVGNTGDIGIDVINVGDNTSSMGLRLNTNLGGTNNSIPSTFSNVNLLSCNNFIPATEAKTYIENWTMNGAFLNGGIVAEINNINSPYTALREDYLIVADCFTADVTIKLPNPSSDNSGKVYVCKKISNRNHLYVTTVSGTFLIDDETTHSITGDKTTHQFISTGSKYYVIVP